MGNVRNPSEALFSSLGVRKMSALVLAERVEREGKRLASNWVAVTESKFPWERDALDFVRERFPTHEPYRAWANFEFIADDGSINDVDLLVCTPQGFFLIEIKSRSGRLFGDAGTW